MIRCAVARHHHGTIRLKIQLDVPKTVRHAIKATRLEIYTTILPRSHSNDFRKRFHRMNSKAGHTARDVFYLRIRSNLHNFWDCVSWESVTGFKQLWFAITASHSVAGILLLYINNFIQIWCSVLFYGMLCGSNSCQMYLEPHGLLFEPFVRKYI